MSKFDVIYNGIVQDIIENGMWDKDQQVRTKWADGSPAYTKSIINKQIRLDNSEVPILTTKKVAWKTSIKEILWIWQLKSNDVDDLRKLNGTNKTVWDEWEDKETKSIGFAYGYQMGKKCRHIVAPETKDLFMPRQYKVDQVDYLLHQLKHNPSSRRHITSLWNIDDLDNMALQPCVWNTHFQVLNDQLHLTVGVRSNDIGLGCSFNIFQYYVLQRMIAQVIGYEVGTLTFNIDNIHAYERHLEPLQEQIERAQYKAPKLWINPKIKDFYAFTIDDFKLMDYQHGESVPLEVAI